MSLSPVASSEVHVQDVFGAESVPSQVADSLENFRESADFEVKTSTPVSAAGQAFQTDSEAEDRKAERTGTANEERAQRRLEVQRNRIELQKALLEEQGDKALTVAAVQLLASLGALVFTPAPFAMAATLEGFNIDMEDGKPDGEQEAPFVDQAKRERIFLREDSCLEILEDSRRLPDDPHPDATIREAAAKKKGEGASGETRGSTPHATPVLKSTSDVCIITPRFVSKESARKEAEEATDACKMKTDEEATALEASVTSPRSSFQKAVEEERARRRLKLLADIEGQNQQQLRQLRLQQLQQHVTQAQKQQQEHPDNASHALLLLACCRIE